MIRLFHLAVISSPDFMLKYVLIVFDCSPCDVYFISHHKLLCIIVCDCSDSHRPFCIAGVTNSVSVNSWSQTGALCGRTERSKNALKV